MSGTAGMTGDARLCPLRKRRERRRKVANVLQAARRYFFIPFQGSPLFHFLLLFFFLQNTNHRRLPEARRCDHWPTLRARSVHVYAWRRATRGRFGAPAEPEASGTVRRRRASPSKSAQRFPLAVVSPGLSPTEQNARFLVCSPIELAWRRHAAVPNVVA